MAAVAVVLGRVCADLRPLPAGATTEAAEGFTREPGGSAVNVAIGLARLGVAPALVSAVGDDAHGRYLRAALAREGVDCAALAVHPTLRTALAFCDLSDPARPQVLLQRGESAPDWEAGPEALDRVDLGGVRLLVAAGTMLWRQPSRLLLLAAFERGAGALRVLDLDWRRGLWGDGPGYGLQVRAAIRLADVVVGGPDEIRAAAGEVPAVRALGARLVVEKRGPEGAVVYERGRPPTAVRAAPVETVDGLGPGDAFVASLGWRLLAGDAPAEAARVACRAGAHVAARAGCASAMPDAEALA